MPCTHGELMQFDYLKCRVASILAARRTCQVLSIKRYPCFCSAPGPSDSGSGGEDEPGTPRISFRWSRSVHGRVLKLSVVAETADRHKKTPEQVRLI